MVAAFGGGKMTSAAGAMLLGATDRAIGLIARFAGCCKDHRLPDLIEHTVATLVGQRVFGIALGREDLLDHDALRHDPVRAILAGKLAARRSNCAPLAGKIVEASPGLISRVTDAALDEVREWQNRALDPVHPFSLTRCGSKIGDDEAALKLLFLAIRNAGGIGAGRLARWGCGRSATPLLFDAATARRGFRPAGDETVGRLDRRAKASQTKRLVARLQNLGYAVQITPLAA